VDLKTFRGISHLTTIKTFKKHIKIRKKIAAAGEAVAISVFVFQNTVP
jgi:hypothetical protein